MRKLLHYLFPLLALVVCVARPSRAEAPQLAVCKDGMCVMSEADYKRLQAFLVRLRDYASGAQERDEQADRALDYAQRKAASCEAALKANRA